MQHPSAKGMPPLGSLPLPRRRYLPPTAVRLAQFLLVSRVAFVAGILVTAGLAEQPVDLVLPGYGRLTLPGGATWRAVALWVVAAALFETVLVFRLGRLRSGSRRVILLVESLVIAAGGLYAAAGVEVALIALVGAIGSVVLLRLDHVRHSFDRARSQRRILGGSVPAVLCEAYAPRDPEAIKEVQAVGYRAGLDCATVEPGSRTRSIA